MEKTPEKTKTSKKRKKSEEFQEVKVVEKATIEAKKAPKVEKVIPKISFSAWFHKKVAERKVRFYEDEAILVFFKKRGLSEMEIEDLYESVFKLY